LEEGRYRKLIGEKDSIEPHNWRNRKYRTTVPDSTTIGRPANQKLVSDVRSDVTSVQ
jgi:hypothetical protein